jgi:hypothetical protein
MRNADFGIFRIPHSAFRNLSKLWSRHVRKKLFEVLNGELFHLRNEERDSLRWNSGSSRKRLSKRPSAAWV